jgi:hypothetical protein
MLISPDDVRRFAPLRGFGVGGEVLAAVLAECGRLVAGLECQYANRI